MTVLLDASGRRVTLGAEIGSGGEGAVFDVADRPGEAAKLYAKPQARAMGDKLGAMIAMANPRLLALCAWPTATLHRPGGELAGFMMPKLMGHRPVFQAYGPKLRLRAFPRADWRFLVHLAGNVARAFAAVHAAGLVVGDVNQSSLFVGADATVRFIDVDSLQVSHGGRTWYCEVGVSTHQPPEMQGYQSFHGVVRTPNHDAFGLAVMVFQILCMGRHPFAGRFQGQGEPPGIDEAIAQSRYAYSADPARTRMTPPPGSLPIGALPPAVRAAFEAAFAPGSVKGGRPTAEHWAGALAALGTSLRRCGTNAAHWHAPEAGTCPWCEVEARSGVALFPAVIVPGQAGQGVLLLWQAITAVREPPALPPLHPPPPAARGSAAAAAAGRAMRGRKLAALALVGLGVLLAVAGAAGWALVPLALAASLWWLAVPQEIGRCRTALSQARARWAELEARWADPGPGARFTLLKQELASLKREHELIPERRKAEMHSLSAGRDTQQLTAHLEGFEIASAKVPGVGKAKAAILLSYGVETAADIEAARIAAVPGFGPKTVAALVAFRRECEAAFRFDPASGVAPAKVSALDGMLHQRRGTIEAEMAKGLVQLRALAVAEERRVRTLGEAAAELGRLYAQAMADATAAGVR